jgi:ABC-2 type transport system ATP-binding protein
MRRRLDIAASLVLRPELLFLDEPTTGLDPRSRNQVWDLVREIAGEGTTVMLTTQYLEEADRLAGRLAVIDQGRIIAQGSSRELKESVGARSLHVRVADPERIGEARAVLARFFGADADPSERPDALLARVSREDLVPEALAALASAGIVLQEFALAQPSLDDVFFALTGHAARTEPDEEAAE